MAYSINSMQDTSFEQASMNEIGIEWQIEEQLQQLDINKRELEEQKQIATDEEQALVYQITELR